jgi:aryl-alcohol dehydrogenase-like predicted oxidoreductase
MRSHAPDLLLEPNPMTIASPTPAIARLGLGTAQLGLDYGATNRSGRPGETTSRAILGRACAAGVTLFDTAPVYGSSEALLGTALPGAGDIRIVSKLPPIAGNAEAFVRDTVAGILNRLDRRQLYGLLVHDPRDLFGPQGEALAAAMRVMQREGLVDKIGASIYRPGEIDRLFTVMTPDIVQLPLSLIDRRAIQSGALARLKGAGAEIHARSVFLQGVLLAPAVSLPSHFAPASAAMGAFERAAERAGIGKLHACLAFALAQPEIDRVIVGVNSPAELNEILEAVGAPAPVGFTFEGFACDNEDILDPNRWPSRNALLAEMPADRK